jgi:hypothetical protein
METVTDKQKEVCAVIAMREAISMLAEKEHISYEKAMLKFTDSKIYDALFDFDTEIWKESSIYLLDLYFAYCLKK